MQTYQETVFESLKHNETNDCSVMALSLALDTQYGIIHSVLRDCGRKERCGVTLDIVNMAALRLGKELVWTQPKRGKTPLSRYTQETIGERFNKGRYLCISSGHIFALIDGKVWDHSKTKKNPIKFIAHVGD